VFLLHGWSGRAGQLGAFVAPLVEAGYSVVAFDTPAHGQSTGKYASALGFSRALAQVIKRFGPAHAVIGHSMGGWAAAHALIEGAPIGRSVLIGAPTDPSAFKQQFSERFNLSDRVIDRMMARAEKRLGVDRRTLELAPRMAAPVGATSQALIVHDRGDTEVVFSNARSWAESWPQAQLLATDGLGHYQALRDREVVQKVLEFVKTGTVQKNAG
jgi:pimeloyl-ACP methyl ester carboxylesterase